MHLALHSSAATRERVQQLLDTATHALPTEQLPLVDTDASELFSVSPRDAEHPHLRHAPAVSYPVSPSSRFVVSRQFSNLVNPAYRRTDSGVPSGVPSVVVEATTTPDLPSASDAVHAAEPGRTASGDLWLRAYTDAPSQPALGAWALESDTHAESQKDSLPSERATMVPPALRPMAQGTYLPDSSGQGGTGASMGDLPGGVRESVVNPQEVLNRSMRLRETGRGSIDLLSSVRGMASHTSKTG